MSGNISKPPYDYATMNWYNSQRSPSTVHVKNTELRALFFKYLFQKAMSVFKWTLPEAWDKDYFLYTLYGLGYIAVLKTPKYGVICQGGSLGGYNLYYRPDYIMITNPLLHSTIRAKIGRDCALVKLMPDYSSIIDKVGYYADILALYAEGVGMNLVNTKFATIFGAENQNQAQAYKTMFDSISEGNPAVVIGKKLLDDQGKPSWFPFTQHVRESYLAADMLSDMRKVEDMFCTDFGIPNANTDKRERLLTDEVNANNTETRTLSELWLESIEKGIKDAKKLFDVNISVTWRVQPEKEGAKNVASNENDRTGIV